MPSKYNINDRVIIKTLNHAGEENVCVGDIIDIQTTFGITSYQLKQTGFAVFDEEEIIGIIKTEINNRNNIRKEIIFTQEISASLQDIIRHEIEQPIKLENLDSFYSKYDNDRIMDQP